MKWRNYRSGAYPALAFMLCIGLGALCAPDAEATFYGYGQVNYSGSLSLSGFTPVTQTATASDGATLRVSSAAGVPGLDPAQAYVGDLSANPGENSFTPAALPGTFDFSRGDAFISGGSVISPGLTFDGIAESSVFSVDGVATSSAEISIIGVYTADDTTGSLDVSLDTSLDAELTPNRFARATMLAGIGLLGPGIDDDDFFTEQAELVAHLGDSLSTSTSTGGTLSIPLTGLTTGATYFLLGTINAEVEVVAFPEPSTFLLGIVALAAFVTLGPRQRKRK